MKKNVLNEEEYANYNGNDKDKYVRIPVYDILQPKGAVEEKIVEYVVYTFSNCEETYIRKDLFEDYMNFLFIFIKACLYRLCLYGESERQAYSSIRKMTDCPESLLPRRLWLKMWKEELLSKFDKSEIAEAIL